MPGRPKKIKRKPPKKTNELPGSKVKLTFKKHLLPPLAGLIVAISIFGFFNSQLLSGKIAYYMYERNANVESLNAQLEKSQIDKGAPPKLIINDIDVKAPVIFGLTSNSETVFQKSLRNGVVHYPNTATPGRQGNVVIFGHSSGQWWAPGDYKFIFTHLDKLDINDRIFLEYEGARYIYRVSATKVVPQTDLKVLEQGTENTLTLITCTPVGTNSKRLIINARQTVPKPASFNQEESPTAPLQSASNTTLPANSSSFWRDFLEFIGWN